MRRWSWYAMLTVGPAAAVQGEPNKLLAWRVGPATGDLAARRTRETRSSRRNTRNPLSLAAGGWKTASIGQVPIEADAYCLV